MVDRLAVKAATWPVYAGVDLDGNPTIRCRRCDADLVRWDAEWRATVFNAATLTTEVRAHLKAGCEGDRS